MFKLLKYSTLGVSSCTIGLGALTLYNYKECRDNPKEIIKSAKRIAHLISGGSQMAYYYLKQGQQIEKKHEIGANILYEMCLKNQGMYIKFGQILATLDILIPEIYRNTLQKLTEHTYHDSYEEIEKIFQKELKKPIDQIFQSFEKQPIKSASIGQVHRATLKNGKKVAVKIQHPGLQEQVKGDIQILSIFVDIGEFLFPEFKYRWFIEELELNLPKELDFNLEISNQKRCHENFKNDINIKVNNQSQVPEVYEQFSTNKIITMEYIDGISLNDKKSLIEHNYDLKHICQLLSQCFCRQIYDFGFVHADPHQVKQIYREIFLFRNKLSIIKRQPSQSCQIMGFIRLQPPKPNITMLSCGRES